MRVLWPALALASCVSAAAVDPRLTSIHPFSGQRGSTFVAVVRGSGLTGASAAASEDAPFRITVEKIEVEPAGESGGRSKTPAELVTLRVQVAGNAKPGKYPVRLLTRNGVSNALPLQVTDLPVLPEPEGKHEAADTAIPITGVPAVLSGRLTRRGEADYFAFEAEAGQTMTFDLQSGLPQIASGGSAATVANFDPSLTLYRPEGSWFDPKRLRRIAYNDEPAWVFGHSTDAHLIYRFSQSGRYVLRVEAFAGQGGPDYSYVLKIAAGGFPQESTDPSPEWEERTWTRKLTPDLLNRLATRGGKPAPEKFIETWHGAAEPVAIKLPAHVEGSLLSPGETHRARFRVDGPADIAMEVETPAAAPPFFNPVVRLLNGSGDEVATNVFAGRGACSGAMTKSLQSKTLVPLRDPGEYTLEVRDATADLSGSDFRYRVQLRHQIPHVGQVRVDADHVNLSPGEAKTVRIFFDREEDYRGAVMIAAESLPPGVSSAVGADFEPDKDDPPAGGKRERYTPRTERAVLVLTAAPDTRPRGELYRIRVVVRPLADGKPGEILASKTIPMMVIEKP